MSRLKKTINQQNINLLKFVLNYSEVGPNVISLGVEIENVPPPV